MTASVNLIHMYLVTAAGENFFCRGTEDLSFSLCLYIHIYMYICACVCTYPSIQIYTHTDTYIAVCVCVYGWIYTYTHMHIPDSFDLLFLHFSSLDLPNSHPSCQYNLTMWCKINAHLSTKSKEDYTLTQFRWEVWGGATMMFSCCWVGSIHQMLTSERVLPGDWEDQRWWKKIIGKVGGKVGSF